MKSTFSTQLQQEQQSIQLFINDEISIFFTIVLQTLQKLLQLVTNYQQSSINYQLLLSNNSTIFQECNIESIPLFRNSQNIAPTDKFQWKLPTQDLIIIKPYLYHNQLQSLLHPYNQEKASILAQYYQGLVSHYQSIQTKFVQL